MPITTTGAGCPGAWTGDARPLSFLTLLADRRIVAVVRHPEEAVAEALAHAAAEGGLRAIEITMSVPGAAALIARLRAALAPQVLVGAGTVLSTPELADVLGAGAQFVVSPGLDRGLVEICAGARVPVLPGVLSPTEVMAARALGLDAVKLFPAETGGPAHLRALRAVFEDMAFVPTGGVTAQRRRLVRRRCSRPRPGGRVRGRPPRAAGRRRCGASRAASQRPSTPP